MSKDLQIAHACPHLIRYERVFLDGGKFISPASPIEGENLLVLRRDGIELPSVGLFREASVISPLKGPYRIKAGANELVVELEGGVSYDLIIPPKIYSTATLVSFLENKLGEISVMEHQLALKFTDNRRGVGFSVRGSVMDSLGFSVSKVRAKPQRITPSWKLRKSGVGGYMLAFDKPLDPEGLLDITYTTIKSQCRRCNATGVENDLRFSTTGDLSIVEGYDLLYQNIAKTLLTIQGSNPYHDWYGSNAVGLVGKKSSTALPSLIRQSVKEALDRFQGLQREQSKLQVVTNEERLLSLDSVSVERIGNDETSVLCTVVVRAASGSPVNINIVFAVPGSIPLDGDLS